MIVAFSHHDFGIGQNNKLPWYIPADLQHFKSVTENHIVVMGKNTFDGLPQKCKPLKNRVNIVLSRCPEYTEIDNVFVANVEQFWSLIDTFKILESFKDKKIFVIGGTETYKLLLPYVHKIHATRVFKKFECDTFLEKLSDFVLEDETPFKWCPVEECNYKFQTYIRNNLKTLNLLD